MVVASGEGPELTLARATRVVAADGGLLRARALGLDVDVVVGDLDSVTPEALAAAEAAGARVVRHPPAKDATDLELALDEAAALGASRVLVVASAEGRLDHLLGLLLLLSLRNGTPLSSSTHSSARRSCTSSAGSERCPAHAPSSEPAPGRRSCPRAWRPRASSIRCAGETLEPGIEPRHLQRLHGQARPAWRSPKASSSRSVPTERRA